MALSTEEQDAVNRLRTRIVDDAPKVRKRETYYEGKLRLEALGLSLPPELRVLQTVVNWPFLVVEIMEERLDVEGFRLSGTDLLDDRLWAWWKANNLQEESSLGHTEALLHGRAYVVVGHNEDDVKTPLITVEEAANMAHERDPRTKKVRNVLRLYDFAPDGQARSAMLYTRNGWVQLATDHGRWREVDRDEHGLGRCMAVPLLNRARTKDRNGRSEIDNVMSMTDAACRALTGLQGAQEILAVPTRYVFGAEAKDFVDQAGNPVPKWEAYLGRFNTLANKDGKVIQLPAADLRNFTETVNFYSKQLAALSGQPAKHFGHSSDANPASGDAIRQDENRPVKKAERRQTRFDGTWEEVMRCGLLLIDGEIPLEAVGMDTVWRDPSTPTYSSKADAVTKLAQVQTADGPMLPRRAAWEEMGWSKAKMDRYEGMGSNDPVARMLAVFGRAPAGMSGTGAPR